MDKRLLWMAVGAFAGATEGFIVGSLLPVVSGEMAVTIGQAGWAVFGYALAYGVGTPILVTLLAGVERRKLLVGAELAFAACAILISLAPHFAWLLAARIAMALGAGLYTGVSTATAVALAPPEKRGRAIGIVVAGQSLAVLVGVPLGALAAGIYGWRVVYAAIAVLALAAAIALWMGLPAGIRGDRRRLRDRLAVLAISGVPIALATTALFMLAAYMMLVYVGPITTQAIGLDKNMLPLVLLANGFGAVLGSHSGGRLADRFGSRSSVIAMAAALPTSLLVFWITPMLPREAVATAFLANMAFVGFVGWSFWPAQASRLAAFDPNSAPLILSLNLTALNFGVALTAVFGGVALDQLGAGSLALFAVPFALGALLLAALSERAPRILRPA